MLIGLCAHAKPPPKGKTRNATHHLRSLLKIASQLQKIQAPKSQANKHMYNGKIMVYSVFMDQEEEKIRFEQFVHAYAFGTPVKEALRNAGYNSVSVVFGMSLLKLPEAQAILDEDRDWIRDKLSCSIDSIAQQLDRDREFAYTMENPAAAVSASMNKARLLGFMETDKNMPKKITIVWEDDDDEPS